MALTICPDCKKKISSRSEHCIYCGCPAFFYRNGDPCEPDQVILSATETRAPAENEKPQMMTIRQAAKIAEIPEHALRGMVKRKEVPFIQSGTRVYVNLPKLLTYLQKH